MSAKHSEAAKRYRGDHFHITSGAERVVTIRITQAEFALLDVAARAKNITRAAMARNILVAAMINKIEAICELAPRA